MLSASFGLDEFAGAFYGPVFGFLLLRSSYLLLADLWRVFGKGEDSGSLHLKKL